MANVLQDLQVKEENHNSLLKWRQMQKKIAFAFFTFYFLLFTFWGITKKE